MTAVGDAGYLQERRLHPVPVQESGVSGVRQGKVAWTAAPSPSTSVVTFSR